MTNYDFFKGFAEDVTQKASAYYFEHDIDERSIGNVLNVERSDTQIKMFHMTSNISLDRNAFGRSEKVIYEGECLFLLPSSAKKTIGTQRGTSEADSRYVDKVKSMVNNGGIMDELYKYEGYLNDQGRDTVSSYTTYSLDISRVQEVYASMGFHGDGINISYTLSIHIDIGS